MNSDNDMNKEKHDAMSLESVQTTGGGGGGGRLLLLLLFQPTPKTSCCSSWG